VSVITKAKKCKVIWLDSRDVFVMAYSTSYSPFSANFVCVCWFLYVSYGLQRNNMRIYMWLKHCGYYYVDLINAQMLSSFVISFIFFI